jgi:hypothetical protein
MRLNKLLEELISMQKSEENPPVTDEFDCELIGINYDPDYRTIVLEFEEVDTGDEEEEAPVIELKLPA